MIGYNLFKEGKNNQKLIYDKVRRMKNVTKIVLLKFSKFFSTIFLADLFLLTQKFKVSKKV